MLIGTLGQDNIEADDRGPCLAQRCKQAAVVRMPEVARFAECAQVVDINADHYHVARQRRGDERPPEHKCAVQQFAVEHPDALRAVHADGRERDQN